MTDEELREKMIATIQKLTSQPDQVHWWVQAIMPLILEWRNAQTEEIRKHWQKSDEILRKWLEK